MGLVARVDPLGDRAHERDVIHLLKRATAHVVERTLPAEHHDRRVGPPRVGDTGHAIGDTGPRSQDRDADLARIESRPSIGGVRPFNIDLERSHGIGIF